MRISIAKIVVLIFCIVFWLIIGVILFNVVTDRHSRIEQNIPSPPKSMVSYRLSKGD